MRGCPTPGLCQRRCVAPHLHEQSQAGGDVCPTVLDDIETLLRLLEASGERGDDWDDILDRWRRARGEDGMAEWRWWWKATYDDLYQTDHATREDALAAALAEESALTVVELIEARCWADDIDVENAKFADSRNYEKLRVRAND